MKRTNKPLLAVEKRNRTSSPQTEGSSSNDYSAKTVEKALEILDYFDAQNSHWGLSELARKSNLSKATAYRLLSSLKKRDFIEHDPVTKKYCLGFKLLELGHRVQDRLNIREIALPYMEELRDKTGETVHLTMEISGEGVYVEKVESYSSVRLSTRLGTRAPLHAGASFKVLLAHLPRNRVEEVIKQGLPKLTEHTIANATALKNELEKIRKQGYAISHGELYDGFTAIAAPIRDSENQVIAGISVIAPSAKYASERVKEMISWVRETANHVSVSMGWSGRGEG